MKVLRWFPITCIRIVAGVTVSLTDGRNSSSLSGVVRMSMTKTSSPFPTSAPLAVSGVVLNPHGLGVSPPDGKVGRTQEGLNEPGSERGQMRLNEKGIGCTSDGDCADYIDEQGHLALKANTIASNLKTVPGLVRNVINERCASRTKEDSSGSKGGVSEKPKKKARVPPEPRNYGVRLKSKGDDASISIDDSSGLRVGDLLKTEPILKPSNLHWLPSQPVLHRVRISSTYPDVEVGSSGSSGSKFTTDGVKVSREGCDAWEALHSFFMSLTMILVSEVGDKTFLVAALMAMRQPRIAVFTAAFSALLVMTVLSSVLGHAVPRLFPVQLTQFIAAALFLSFGARMVLEAGGMSSDDNASAEMQEVETEVEEKTRSNPSVTDPYSIESARVRTLQACPISTTYGFWGYSSLVGLFNLCSLLLDPIWVQTFVMTFLAEWGDRSQIATIAMAAGRDFWFVTLGAVVGHSVCTGAAVISGRAIAGRVSMRLVTLSGGVAFIAFGIVYLYNVLSD